MDYVQTWVDETGKKQKISDYNIFGREDSRDLRLVISSLNEIFASRGFETISLEFLLKSVSMENDENAFIGNDYGLSGTVKESPLDRIKRSANVDFIVDLDFALYLQALGVPPGFTPPLPESLFARPVLTPVRPDLEAFILVVAEP